MSIFIIAPLIMLIKRIMSYIFLAVGKETMEPWQYSSTAEQENLVRMFPVPPTKSHLSLKLCNSREELCNDAQ